MPDNTQLNLGAGGDITRDIDKGGVKTTVVTLDVGGAGAESLVAGTVPVSGTVAVTSGTLATTANQTTEIASLASIDGKLTNPLPVSGTVAITSATLATTAKQDTGNTSLASIDGKITAVNTGSVTVVSAPTTAVTSATFATAAKQDTLLAELQLKADLTETQPVSLATLPALTAGAAVIGHVIADTGSTTAVTGNVAVTNAGLTNIDTALSGVKTGTDRIPAQGQALAAASTPVVLTAAQVTTLTPPAAIVGFALEATQLTGNTSIASVKTNTDPLVASGAGGYVRQDSTATMAKETGGNLATVKTNTDPLVAAAGGGYVRQDSTATIAKETGGNLATIATNSALAATAAKQDTGNASLVSILAELVLLLSSQGATSTGAVGPMMQAVVSDAPPSYLPDTIQPLSVNTEGRLRTTMTQASTYIELFRTDNPLFDLPDLVSLVNPCAIGDHPYSF